MKIKQKWTAGVGVALSIGAVFWMRTLVSWRPVVVGKVGFTPSQLKFSRDGQVLVKGDKGAAILNIKSGVVDSAPEHIHNLIENQSLKTFPRLAFDERSERVIFSPSPRKSVMLHDLGIGRDIVGIKNGKSPRYGWSQLRREVYAGFMGEIYTWNWDDGKLKGRVRFAKEDDNQFAFSPDGKWLLAFERRRDNKGLTQGYLRRYAVQNGRMVQLINIYPAFSNFGFSPDGRFFWFIQGYIGQPEHFNLMRADDWKWIGGSDCAGPVKWVSDTRAGIVKKNGFTWHDGVNAAGKNLSRNLPGPFQPVNSTTQSVTDWALSLDENWIYSAHSDGTIRKWRAR